MRADCRVGSAPIPSVARCQLIIKRLRYGTHKAELKDSNSNFQVLEAIVEMNLITLKLSEEDLNKFEKARFLTLFGTANTPRVYHSFFNMKQIN